MTDTERVAPDQLRVGMYVYLDLKWFDHPFAFNHFKIKSPEQIETLRALGLPSLRMSRALSDPEALVGQTPALPPMAQPQPALEQEPSPVMLAKRAMMAQMKERREAAERIERAFVDTANTLRDIEKNLYSNPAQTLQQAHKLVDKIAESILNAPELAIAAMSDKLGGEDLYFHSLNVTMLALMLARELKLPTELMGPLGVGALLHDIGRKEVPDRILLKTEPLTTAERNLYEQHPNFGVEMARRMALAPAALDIIGQHHELIDGSGYPQGLKGEAISLLARLVAIANYYDELCNPPMLADALTPHEALSLMFAKLRSKFDPAMLKVFIRCLGVYPPGSVVQLSNGFIAMVSTVNTARPLKPLVVVYDAEVPKEEAMILDLGNEPELSISKAIRPNQLPREIYAYLSPRKHVSYYFDARQGPKPSPRP
jgi:putative nucleotidyltransferase with HDIG domain